jgi:hypothetical protein
VALNTRDEGFEHETKDCVVKALQAVTGVPYRDAHAVAASRMGRKDRHGCAINALSTVAHTRCTIYGYRVFAHPPQRVGTSGLVSVDSYGRRVRYVRPRYETLTQFVRRCPRGRYFLASNSHAFAVIDGVVYDNGAAGARTQVTNVYEFVTDSQCEREGR